MFRSALLILSGNLTSYMLLFLRNLLVARLIGVSDYGIASTFLLSMSIVEMMSALGIQQQLILRKDGDDADLHRIQIRERARTCGACTT